MAQLASDDDVAVGRALDQIDALLAQGGSSWAELGAKLAGLGAPPPVTTPARVNGKRPPSAYAADRADIETLMEHQDQIRWPAFRDSLLPSFYEQVVEQQRTLSEKQRALVHEQLDKLGL